MKASPKLNKRSVDQSYADESLIQLLSVDQN